MLRKIKKDLFVSRGMPISQVLEAQRNKMNPYVCIAIVLDNRLHDYLV
jgi:hypothetical protein